MIGAARRNFGARASEAKTQRPGAGSGVSIYLWRIEFPALRRLQRQPGKILTRPRGRKLGLGHLAGSIHVNAHHDSDFSMDRIPRTARDIGQDLLHNFTFSLWRRDFVHVTSGLGIRDRRGLGQALSSLDFGLGTRRPTAPKKGWYEHRRQNQSDRHRHEDMPFRRLRFSRPLRLQRCGNRPYP